MYNHPRSIGAVVEQLRTLQIPCWLIDDGSAVECQQVLRDLATREASWVRLERLPSNQGKGQAMAHGFACALAAGHTHALQIDADGQHDPADAEKLLAQACAYPEAVVTGIPIFDESVPKGRLYGRYLTHVWVWINTASLQIRDSMCGFRVYPLAATVERMRAEHVGPRMEFDTEILVRLFWNGVPVISVPTRVRYPSDGISHFRLWRDNVRITLMHTRLFCTMLARRCGLGHKLRTPPALLPGLPGDQSRNRNPID